MHLGVFTVLFADRSFEATLDHVKALGLDAVEIGTGAYPGSAHCDPAKLLADPKALGAFRKALGSRGLFVSALSCHGNPVHPDPKVAAAHHQTFVDTVALARALDVSRVVTFSGCPAGDPHGRSPNWITSAWPPEFQKMLAWQWRERVTPYWKDAARLCRRAGVQVAIEMHPSFVVYNPETMLRLADIAPKVIGCNFDPSHMFWQGIDPVVAIRALGDRILHVHAKDCRIDVTNTRQNGVLDVKKYTEEARRSWIFRTVGYGHDALVWKDIISALRVAGYDHVISIEHEDSVMSPDEGLRKAVVFLQGIVIRDEAGEVFWA